MDQNLTTGPPPAGVTHWRSSPQMSETVQNAIVVLGVLTFALQLCLVLFVVLKCRRLDRMRRNEKPRDVSKHQIYTPPPPPPPTGFTAVRVDEDGSDFLCPPSPPWDLYHSGGPFPAPNFL